MSSEIWPISQPNSVFTNQFSVSSEGILISNCMQSVYLFKIQQSEEVYPEEGKNSLLSIVNKYIIDFFRVERGQDDDLKTLTKDLIKILRKFIRNIKIDDDKFVLYAMNEFSLFHSEIIDFQMDKSREILNAIRNTYKLKEKIKKMFVVNLDLEHEIEVFMTKIAVMKTLTSSSFSDLFFSTFKDFFEDFSEAVKETVRTYIQRSIDAFDHMFEKSLVKTKNRLHSYLLDIVQSIDPVRLSILMREVPTDMESFGPWIVCFEKVIDREKVELKQVVHINETSLIITISFTESNRYMVVFSNQHIISVCEHDLLDSETIICEGSSLDNLVFIHNKLRQAFIVLEANNKLEAKTELKKFFTQEVSKISSAVYLRKPREIISIDTEGNLSIFTLTEKIESKSSEIVPTKYKKIGISACGNFIYLLSRTETYVFTNKCELVIQDFSLPDIACLTKKHLIIGKIGSDENIKFACLPIDGEYVAEQNVRTSLTENIEYQVRNTISFGRELMQELLKRNNFDHFTPPDVIPK